MKPIVCVGTSAHAAWFSKDLGETWERPTSKAGLYLETAICSIATHPKVTDCILAGTDAGIWKWVFAEERWTHLPSPMDEPRTSVWSLVRAPHNPDILLAGTRPPHFYRSDDGGKSWRKLHTPMSDGADNETRASRGYSNSQHMRVTRMMFDPADPETLWAGIEIDAIHRSKDGGKTWTRLSKGLISDDIHDLLIPRGSKVGARRLFATTNKGLHSSEDEGATWNEIPLNAPWPYTRTITPRADTDEVIFLTNGNGPPGSTGRLLRSRDSGNSWQDVGLPGSLNSTPWCVATNPADPLLIFACSNLGQIFRSQNGGDSWTRLGRELGDIRSMCWLPID